MRRVALTAIGAAWVLGIAVPAAGILVPAAHAGAASADPMRLTSKLAHLAQVVYPTAVRADAGSGRTMERMGTEAQWGGGPVRLLVLRSRLDDQGERWLQVRLPSRPNDANGWIREDDTRASTTRWRVVVALRARRIQVLRDGRVVRRMSAVIGAPGTPTPTGLFAVSERIRQTSGPLGPWALHLTSHSDVLDDYGGGPGRVAIHGRSGALLDDPLGSALSHGCVRIDNAQVLWLASRAIEGTPVLVRR